MKPQTVESYQQRISLALLHIQNHLDTELSLEALADVARFSPFHFHRIFRGMVGESVKEHIRRLRLERAARQLRSSQRPVLEIALDAGYEAHESFTRAFADAFQMSPSDFRRNNDAPFAARLPDAQPSRASEFRIRRLDPMRLVYIRHTGPYNEVGSAWSRLFPWAGMQGLLGPGMRMVGVSYDDPDITAPDKLRYDAAITVPRPVTPIGEFGVQEIPAGDYAVALHTGPYSTLSGSYAELAGKFLPTTGRELRDASALEFYLNSPGMTPEDHLMTEICLPLTAAD